MPARARTLPQFKQRENGFLVRSSVPSDFINAWGVIRSRWKGMEPSFSKQDLLSRLSMPHFNFMAKTNRKIVGVLLTACIDPHDMPTRWSDVWGKSFEVQSRLQSGERLWESVGLLCPLISARKEHSGFGVAQLLIRAAREHANKIGISLMGAYSRFSSYLKFSKDVCGTLGAGDYLKWSLPGNPDEAHPAFSHITRMPGGTEAYFQFRSLASGMGWPEDLNAFYLWTKRKVYDPTIRLHMSLGARIGRLLLNGCPDDLNSGGTNVIMLYSPGWPSQWQLEGK